MMNIEQSAERLADFGATRGQTIFRFCCQPKERVNETGGTETYWECRYSLLNPIPAKEQTTDKARELILAQLQRDVNEYITEHYDQGTQASFQALYSLTSTPEEVKTALIPVWAWIQSVMEYYYAIKTAVRESNDPCLEIWDFSQFNVTDPNVSLEAFMG